METTHLLRPLLQRPPIPLATKLSRRAFTTTGPLAKQTAARMKRHLNIAPHTSFLAQHNQETEQIVFNPPSSAPSVYNTPFKFLPKTDPRRRASLASHFFADSTNPIPKPSDIGHLVAGYPPAAPIVHTHTSASSASATSAASATSTPPSASDPSPSPSQEGAEKAAPKRDTLPPASRSQELLAPKHHLTPQDVEAIRRLRLASPSKWSVVKLAKKFDCAEMFIMACVQAPDEHQKKLRDKAAKAKEKWGTIRRRARDERAKRKTLLMSGRL